MRERPEAAAPRPPRRCGWSDWRELDPGAISRCCSAASAGPGCGSRGWRWTMPRSRSTDPAEVHAVVDPAGVEVGMLELDFREPGACADPLLGLVPELAGKGHGRWLMAEALALAWRDGRRAGLRPHLHARSSGGASAYLRRGLQVPYRRAFESFPDPRLIGFLPADVAPQIPVLTPRRRCCGRQAAQKSLPYRRTRSSDTDRIQRRIDDKHEQAAERLSRREQQDQVDYRPDRGIDDVAGDADKDHDPGNCPSTATSPLEGTVDADGEGFVYLPQPSKAPTAPADRRNISPER